mgnify:CR=1 FL=1
MTGEDAVQNLRLDTLEQAVQTLTEAQTSMQTTLTELITQSRTLQTLVKALGGLILGGVGIGGAAVGLG